MVRALFLASAVQTGLLPYLRTARRFDDIAQRIDCRRSDRLHAWLGVGVDLGELGSHGETYRVIGRRGRALAEGDHLLVAHYRSMLEYQVGPYADLASLLRDDPGTGRDDLDRYAEDIARVSLAAAPFVRSLLRDIVTEVRPVRVVDAGCGSGDYTKAVLQSDPAVEVDGIDLSEEVIVAARRRLDDAGLGGRARLHAGDIEDWLRGRQGRFDLVLLLNNVYYFDPARRPDLYRQIAGCLTGGGEMLVVSMTTPGSIAAAHLDFMLTCQGGAASLPRRADLVADIAGAGFEIVEVRRLVPTEPFVGVRARRAR
jgi:SAM-dependent methyltransferase